MRCTPDAYVLDTRTPLLFVSAAVPLKFVRLWDRADGKAGLFNLEEFNQRLDAVFSATTQSQLSTLICVLPPGRPRLLRHPSGPSRICRRPTSGDACERLR
jgi:hypothetical protein